MAIRSKIDLDLLYHVDGKFNPTDVGTRPNKITVDFRIYLLVRCNQFRYMIISPGHSMFELCGQEFSRLKITN